MLSLEPSLVKMERAERPTMHFTPEMEKLSKLSRDNPKLASVWNLMLGVPSETKKGGASSEISSNGVWTLKDPRSANAEIGHRTSQRFVDQAVDFIQAWKMAKP